jgi:hypothetical protein
MKPITVATRSVFAPSKVGVVGSNTARGMDVCETFSVFVLSCVQIEVLRRDDPLSKESCRLCVGLRTEKAAKVQQKDSRAIDT